MPYKKLAFFAIGLNLVALVRIISSALAFKKLLDVCDEWEETYKNQARIVTDQRKELERLEQQNRDLILKK